MIPFDNDESWDEPTWRVALNHQLDDNIMIYGSYNRGFKSGLFNAIVTGGQPEPAVNPETLDAYEVGFKGDFMNRRLRLNLAAFYYDYQDIQLVNVEVNTTRLINAAEAEVLGIELQGQAAITDRLDLRFGVAYLDATYDSFPGCPINTPADSVLGPAFSGLNIRESGDCNDNDMVRSPDLTANLGIYYFVPTDLGSFSGSVNAAYNDGFFWEPGNRVKEPDYTVVNAEVSWRSIDERYEVKLYGRNLLDEEYSPYTTEGSAGDHGAAAAPLTYGVAFKMYLN